MSLSFLFCKPWHPATTWNQKKIWEAEQKHEKRKKDEERANKELSRDIDRRHYEQMANGQPEGGSSRTVDFMYAPPPGFQQPQDEELDGDDEAVKKFKALAKMKSDPNFSAGSRCSELEKLVGRRVNPGVSLAEQQERFSFLKNAPVEHEYAADVKVNFKPFNKVIRHVKCMRCGEWGHRSGDRECKMANENPNDRERMLREDPMSFMTAGTDTNATRDGSGASTAAEAAAASARGGEGARHDAEDDDPDAAFLKSLSSKEKKRLLRRLQEMEATEAGKNREGKAAVEEEGVGEVGEVGDGGSGSRWDRKHGRKRKREHKEHKEHKVKRKDRDKQRDREKGKGKRKERRREKRSRKRTKRTDRSSSSERASSMGVGRSPRSPTSVGDDESREGSGADEPGTSKKKRYEGEYLVTGEGSGDHRGRRSYRGGGSVRRDHSGRRNDSEEGLGAGTTKTRER